MAAAFAFSASAQAQYETYVDLSVEITAAQSLHFTARNHGTATAYGVTMDIELADQAIAVTLAGEEVRSVEFEQKSGTTCSGNIPGTTCINGTFPIGTLAPGEEKSFYITTKLAPGLPCCSNPINDYWMVPSRAVVKNTITGEEERFKGDNTDTKWIRANGHDSVYNASHVFANYWLEASVDNLLPEAGDTVKFSFEAERFGGINASVFGAKVRLKLDEGMGTPTATPATETFAAATGLTRTWDWDFDLEHPLASRTLEVSTTLDDPLPVGVAVSDLCLTAELTAERPNNISQRPTSAEICLREDPVVLLQEGDAILFNMYPCVSVTAYPCTSSDTLEVRGTDDGAARAAGIARDEAILDPDSVFIQVKDPEARLIDTQSTSVNSGTAPSWQTAREPDARSGNRTVGGVGISYTRREFDSTQIANYSNLARTMAVTALDGGAAPGLVKVRYPGSGNVFYDLTTTGSHERPTFGLSSASTSLFAYFAEFTTLGTYKMDFTAAVTHTDTNIYSDTGSYIFHVGPVAELEARDKGPNPELASTQRAFTILAVNNGPDDAPDAQVTVTGLNTSDYVSHSATSGTFNSTTGVWTIDELRDDSGYYRTTGHPLGWPTLTIITSAAADTEITAAISNTQDYQVCIDSSGDDVAAGNQADCKTESGNTNAWHAAVCVNTADNEIDSTITVEATCDSTTDRAWTENVCASSAGGVLAAHTEAICFGWHTTEYYDYISDNSTGVTIKAKDGTGADLPTLQSPDPKTAAIEVTWNAEMEVNGRAVTHYELAKTASPCATLANDLMGTEVGRTTTYVDTQVNLGTTYCYYVRAVNDRDHKGPWSAPMSGTVMEPEIDPPGRPTGMRAAPVSGTEILVFWSTPAGAVVDHYELEVSEDGGDPWDRLGGNLAANSYNHKGLQEGDTRHYRVRAWNTDDPQEEGPWSATVSATTDAAAPPPPSPPPPRVITRTETVTVGETPFARFSPTEVSRSVAENSAPGSAVGAPVAVLRNSGNRVTYSLEGTDASLFTIEADTGQILVGQDTVLDYESGTTSYTVEVVADPSSGSNVRATVTITVTDVAETATVAITPAGQPQVDVELTATLTHGGGTPADPVWQWQRSATGGTWLNIAGATSATYTPTAQDAGKRLRVIVFYGDPGGGYGLAGTVTEALAGGETTETAPLSDLVAGYDADSNGGIDLTEVLAAIAAYFAEDLDLDGVLEVIAAYFTG